MSWYRWQTKLKVFQHFRLCNRWGGGTTVFIRLSSILSSYLNSYNYRCTGQTHQQPKPTHVQTAFIERIRKTLLTYLQCRCIHSFDRLLSFLGLCCCHWKPSWYFSSRNRTSPTHWRTLLKHHRLLTWVVDCGDDFWRLNAIRSHNSNTYINALTIRDTHTHTPHPPTYTHPHIDRLVYT